MLSTASGGNTLLKRLATLSSSRTEYAQAERVTKLLDLQLGESALEHAPIVPLANGEMCIAQQHLLYKHTRASVEKIVLDIEYHKNYPIFVGAVQNGEQQSIYIQIGIVGYDNYPKRTAVRKTKLVYGRKWRVEPSLPTSEIIQTVFLALKVAREHEVRELLTLKVMPAEISPKHSPQQSSAPADAVICKVSTPFNNHHDLPLLARLQKTFTERELSRSVSKSCSVEQIKAALSKLRYDGASFTLENLERRFNSDWLLDIKITVAQDTRLEELRVHNIDGHESVDKSRSITLILASLSVNQLYFALMDALLLLSEQQVANNFSYRGFCRFNKNNDLAAIAELSISLRQSTNAHQQDAFVREFSAANYQIDKGRVPSLFKGALTDKIHKNLQQIPELEGVLPQIS